MLGLRIALNLSLVMTVHSVSSDATIVASRNCPLRIPNSPKIDPRWMEATIRWLNDPSAWLKKNGFFSTSDLRC